MFAGLSCSMVYRHFEVSIRESHTEAEVQEARRMMFAITARPHWNGSFMLHHAAHSAVAHWVMAGAAVGELLGEDLTPSREAMRQCVVRAVRRWQGCISPYRACCSSACRFAEQSERLSNKAKVGSGARHPVGSQSSGRARNHRLLRQFSDFLSEYNEQGMPYGFCDYPAPLPPRPGMAAAAPAPRVGLEHSDSWVRHLLQGSLAPPLQPGQKEELIGGIGRGSNRFRVMAVEVCVPTRS